IDLSAGATHRLEASPEVLFHSLALFVISLARYRQLVGHCCLCEKVAQLGDEPKAATAAALNHKKRKLIGNREPVLLTHSTQLVADFSMLNKLSKLFVEYMKSGMHC